MSSPTREAVAKFKNERRALAPNRPVAPRAVRKEKRPWVIMCKSRKKSWWGKDRVPTWRIYKRYATEKAREQALLAIRRSDFWSSYYEYRLVKDKG